MVGCGDVETVAGKKRYEDGPLWEFELALA